MREVIYIEYNFKCATYSQFKLLVLIIIQYRNVVFKMDFFNAREKVTCCQLLYSLEVWYLQSQALHHVGETSTEKSGGEPSNFCDVP